MTLYGNLLSSLPMNMRDYMSKYDLSNEGKAFLFTYGVIELGLTEPEAEEAVSYDGGNDKSIDLFYIDEELKRVIIAQGKYDRRGDHKANEGDFLKLVHTTDWLSNPESLRRDGRPDLADAAEDYKQDIAKEYSVNYHYVYLGPSKKELIDAANNFNIANGGNIPLKSARIVSIDLFNQIYDQYNQYSLRVNEESLELRPEQAFEEKGTFGRALVASLPATELRRLYEAHGNALFDRNVRLYLGARKGSVNAGIQETLQSTKERPNFWAYNNGITFICDNYDYDAPTNSLHIRNFSIVNGCQSTVSIAQGPLAAMDTVSVLARFIEAIDEQVVDSIIRFNNSQTPIRPWDISTQDKIQKRLKIELATASKPYFYELRRGETREMTSEERRPFFREGKFQVIRFDILAQYLAAFRGLAIPAYKDKNSLFEQYKHEIFPTDLSGLEAIFIWQSAEAIAAAVNAAKLRAAERGMEERLRILKRGAHILAISVLAVVLRERNGSTYVNRIKMETACSKATRERLDKYATVSVSWYLEIVGDLLSNGVDLTKMIRSQQIFQRVEDKLHSKWEIQSASKRWVDDALPMIQ